MNLIESKSNAKFKSWLSLTESKGIKKEGLALLSGSKLVHELAAQNPTRIVEILLPPKGDEFPGDFRQTRLSAPLFQELDVIGTRSALAVVQAPALPSWDASHPPQGLQLILALSDPSNLGSCLRSAEAFGATQVILTQECASPYLPKALRASSGGALRLKLTATGPIRDLRCTQAVGLDMNGTRLQDFKWPRDTFLILGEEGQGLPASLKLERIAIPMRPPVESLNATVAAALAMYSYSIAASAAY